MIPYPTRDTDDFSLTDFRSKGNGDSQKHSAYVAETKTSAPVRRDHKPETVSYTCKRPFWGALKSRTTPLKTSLYLRNLSQVHQKPSLADKPKPKIGHTCTVKDDSTLIDAGDKIVPRQKVEGRAGCSPHRHSTDVVHADRQQYQLQARSRRSAPVIAQPLMTYQGDIVKKVLLMLALLITILAFESMSSKLIDVIKAKTGLS
ncbi:LAQU0S03e09560g1_1 [Lachancea quebecensis]|uniref:LAQU0S03e09560g1_1 n=1 Tax=Lachancea quebecensis TaxID=1654605 RepID=A0A0P1KS33_9SACH|nr:LAQU0S03e09560g1_1 [Lachancea quebecensis]